MNHLDITIDFETASLAPTAAVLQIGATAWDRSSFEFAEIDSMESGISLDSCFQLGLDFSKETQKWWEAQPDDVRSTVFGGTRVDVKDAVIAFLDWLKEVKDRTEAKTMCIWSQGSDFDIAILRNIMFRFGFTDKMRDSFFRHTDVRDARTYILEMGRVAMLNLPADGPSVKQSDIYDQLPLNPMLRDQPEMKHTALYDARKTSYQLWTIMKADRVGK